MSVFRHQSYFSLSSITLRIAGGVPSPSMNPNEDELYIGNVLFETRYPAIALCTRRSTTMGMQIILSFVEFSLGMKTDFNREGP